MVTEDDPLAARWESMWPHFLPAVKTAIVEALAWVDEPLSAVQLHRSFGGEVWSLNLISHHLHSLAKLGLLEVTDERRVRGATQIFFFFPDA